MVHLAAKLSGAHYKKRGPGESVQMDGRSRTNRDGEGSKVTLSKKNSKMWIALITNILKENGT